MYGKYQVQGTSGKKNAHPSQNSIGPTYNRIRFGYTKNRKFFLNEINGEVF
jgi:hypothetical protein